MPSRVVWWLWNLLVDFALEVQKRWHFTRTKRHHLNGLGDERESCRAGLRRWWSSSIACPLRACYVPWCTSSERSSLILCETQGGRSEDQFESPCPMRTISIGRILAQS
jgi:hypothetical protein